MRPQYYYDQPLGWQTPRHFCTEQYPYFQPPAISDVVAVDGHGYRVVQIIEAFDAWHIMVVALTNAEALAYIRSMGRTTDAGE